MANIANIVAFDGATTPVSHTLMPVEVSRDQGVSSASWRENLSAVPVNAQVTAGLTLRTLKSGVLRSELTVDVPVMESVSGANAAGYTAAPKVAYSDRFTLIGYHHPRSTQASRRLARQLLLNIAGSISTSAAPVTTGPWPEVVDSLVMPT